MATLAVVVYLFTGTTSTLGGHAMRQWIALALVLGLTEAGAGATAPLAAQTPAPAAIPAAAQARSDSLAHAALAATVARRRLFVDVRTPEEYADEHLPGALNLPLAELEIGRASCRERV